MFRLQGNLFLVSVYKDINSYVYQKNGTFSMDPAWETGWV